MTAAIFFALSLPFSNSARANPYHNNFDQLTSCLSHLTSTDPSPFRAEVFVLESRLQARYGKHLHRFALVGRIAQGFDRTLALVSEGAGGTLPAWAFADEMTFLRMNHAQRTTFEEGRHLVGHITVTPHARRAPAPAEVTESNTRLGDVLQVGGKFFVVIAKNFRMVSASGGGCEYQAVFNLAKFDQRPARDLHSRGTVEMEIHQLGDYQLNRRIYRNIQKLGRGSITTESLIKDGHRSTKAAFHGWEEELPLVRTIYELQLHDFESIFQGAGAP